MVTGLRWRMLIPGSFVVAVMAVLFSTATASAAPPSNDALTAATVLTGSSGSVSGDDVGATYEEGEYVPSNLSGTVWFKWTPATGGAVSFSTVDTPMGDGYANDTVLAVFTGTSVDALAEVAWNDDVDVDNYLTGGLRSRVSFEAVAGTTYWISLDTWYELPEPATIELPPATEPPTPSNPSQGQYSLSWSTVERDPSADIADTIGFFQASVGAGAISGVGGATSAAGKLAAFEDMLTAAEVFIAQGEYTSAIGQLNAVYAKCDDSPHPPDFIQGSAKQELANRVLALIARLQARL